MQTTTPSPSIRLDLRELLPLLRRARLLSAFDELRPFEALELVSDQDPQPLQASLLARFGGQCAWSALEQGPAVWRALLTRTEAPAARGSCCSGGACGG